jgi:hypothetical protein
MEEREKSGRQLGDGEEKEAEEGGTASADSDNALAPTPKPTPSQTGMRSWPTTAAVEGNEHEE